MSWRDRVAALPVTMLGHVVGDGECIEAQVDNVHVIASHVFVPLAGNVLMFSLSGPQGEVGAFASHLDEEMDSPAAREILPNGLWMRSYPSPLDTLPTVHVHTKVSSDRIGEICVEKGLNPTETRMLQEMIVSQSLFVDNAMERIKILHAYLRRCDNAERGRIIVDALAAVRAEVDAAL